MIRLKAFIGSPQIFLSIKTSEVRVNKKVKVKTEVYSRVSGYFRPTSQWNKGKQEEFKDRIFCDPSVFAHNEVLAV